MNDKTVKLIKKYARATGKPEGELKQWWQGLNWKERTRERRRLVAELSGPAAAAGTEDDS